METTYALSSPRSLLVLEDNDLDFAYIEAMLQQSYSSSGVSAPECVRASTLGEAASYLREKQPDILVCDLTLPDSSGVDTIQQVLEHCSAPVVILTGEELRNDLVEMAIRGGAQDILEKGKFSREDLRKSIEFAIERDELRQRCERLQAELQDRRRHEAIGRLSSGVAHDINNTIMIARGFAECILAKPDPTQIEKSVREILNASDRIRDLVLQLSMVGGTINKQVETLELGQLASDLRSFLANAVPNEIEIDVQRNGESWVLATPTQLHQIMMNLVLNAADALIDKGRITITSEQQGDQVILKVSDDGPGIPADLLPNITNPFVSSKANSTHSGLGLSIVQGIMHDLDGQLDVQSSPDGVAISCIFKAAACPPDRKNPLDRDMPGSEPGQITILLVDDEDGVRSFLKVILELDGYQILEAENGRRAKEMLDSKDHSIDLVISDIMMPEMDGTELVKKLMEQDRDIPVILISGQNDGRFGLNEIGAEHIPILRKPFSHEDLSKEIARTIPA